MTPVRDETDDNATIIHLPILPATTDGKRCLNIKTVHFKKKKNGNGFWLLENWIEKGTKGSTGVVINREEHFDN